MMVVHKQNLLHKCFPNCNFLGGKYTIKTWKINNMLEDSMPQAMGKNNYHSVIQYESKHKEFL